MSTAPTNAKAAVPKPTGSNTASLKRKASSKRELSSRKTKRVKIQDARVIAAQTTGQAFGNGQVNVDKFVQAREYEIRALEDGMRRSRKGLSARAFQNVPRDLRRRTASHNVKRVPKRLRRRAAKEMAEDNTPTVSSRSRKPSNHMRLRLDIVKRLKQLGTRRAQKKEPPKQPGSISSGFKEPRVKKNTLQKPPKPKARFRKRQIHKSWLPTHIFHAKRARMTPAKQPLWRMAIPLTPTAKSYRPTHRASSARGAVAWDMSYMSTIGLTGPENSIRGLLKAIGVGTDDGVTFWDQRNSKWMQGIRTWSGWVYERNQAPLRAIAPVTIVWSPRDGSSELARTDGKTQVSKSDRKNIRKALIRVHPSAFLQLWEEVLKLSKVQKPSVAVDDLRFEIGSIELVGPGAAEALVGTLWPVYKHENDTHNDASDIWPLLRPVTNPANLPLNAVLSMNVVDPRLHYPARKESPAFEPAVERRLVRALAEWPIDKALQSSDLFDRKSRLLASRQLPSQKAINRRKALAVPGEYPQPKETDPSIPILLLASRGGRGNQGTWILLLPWKCVLPVWYCLMHYPLSSGTTVRFGGLDERRQVLFESALPWFPGDFPGTTAGAAWETKQREERKGEWERKPKGKRVEWASVSLGPDQKGEVGLGWACDWSKLFPLSDYDSGESNQPVHLPARTALEKLKLEGLDDDSETFKWSVVTVKVTLLSRGTPSTCARIYRLPLVDAKLRSRWLSLQAPKERARHGQPRERVSLPKDAPAHVRRQHLAASLLAPPQPLRVGDDEYPRVPGEQDLMGFVTTGSFNLAEGRGTGIGGILLHRALEGRLDNGHRDQRRLEHLCIVRDAGQTHGRLATWEVVS